MPRTPPSPAGSRRSEHVTEIVQRLPVRVALLRNFLAPYEIPWLQELQRRVSDLWVVASKDTHPTLPWAFEFGDLKVVEQERFALTYRQGHPAGFFDPTRVHIPRGTFKHLRRLRPDVIVSSELGARTVQALAYARLSRRAKLLVVAALSERSEAGRGTARRLLRRFLVRQADALITPGASGARYLEGMGARRERIFVVPRTTDMSPYLELPINRDGDAARRLFFPGQLIERKGLLPFLDVLGRWATVHGDRRVEFCLLGDGPLRAVIEARPRPPNLAVRFWKAVPYAELPRSYGLAGILAFPTLSDEWGLVVNEALASGVPVLGSVHSQAVEELVADGVNGWKFDPERPGETYRAIDRALTAPMEHLSAMRVTARKSVERLTPEWAAGGVAEALRFAWLPKVHARGTNEPAL